MSSDTTTEGRRRRLALTSLVNHFSIKREAHSLSRQSSDQTWNPFRHLHRSRRAEAGRVETWDAPGLESNRRINSGLPLTTFASAPPLSSSSTAAATTGALPSQSSQHPLADAFTAEPAAGERPMTTPSTADSDACLRKRRAEVEAEAEEDSGMRATAVSTTGRPQNKGAEADDEDDKSKSKSKGGLLRHVSPKEPFTVANQLQRTLLSSWINVLMLAAPAGIALNYVPSVNRIAVFVVNFIAIVPLASMLGFATEEIALRTGETLGGLLNATFGNAVELIVAIIALKDGKVAIVQTSLIGSILSNLLLVMGCCFFFGGLRRREQHFNTVVAQTAASMLALATASVIVPTLFDSAPDTPVGDVAKLSRGTAIILLVVYAAYLFFQLKTHHEVFSEESQKVPAKPWSKDEGGHGSAKNGMSISQGLAQPVIMLSGSLVKEDDAVRFMNPAKIRHSIGGDENRDGDEDGDDEEEPQLHFWVAVATLTISTVIIALCAEYMVDSIDAVTRHGGLSEEFVGLILLPIVGNAAEHATAVTVAIKDKMDLAIGVAVGSSMQVALFLIPLLVVIGWGMGNDAMNLSFDTFQVAVMFVAVLLVNYLIGDGKSHWLEGWLLICLYAIIAVCAIWYPNQDTAAMSS